MDDMVATMQDQAIADLILAEENRQRDGLELIPSENYVSRDILTAMGSVFTNKYSEGFPGRRYYGGQENTDQVERIAIERAVKLFDADHANVQPHSGAQANEAAFHAWCEPGDTILAMELSHGGHLTHGRPGTVLAKLFNYVRYGMKDIETGEIDYQLLRSLALKHKPKIILAGFSSFPRELDYAKFAEIANETGAVLMMDMAHIAGLIAGKALKNPFDYGFHIVTTTTHKTLRGPRGGMILTRGTVGNPLRAPEKTIENLPVLVDRSVFPGVQGGPLEHIIAAKAVSFYEAAQPEFQTYAKQVLSNSRSLADALMKHGFKLITNGTDNHMMVADVHTSFGLHGGEVEAVLDRVGLNLNKNVIPDDPLPPFKPSGVRLGTPAITTRGLREQHMEQIAVWMLAAINARNNEKKLDTIKAEVTAFSRDFPLPSDS
ncbi:MAG TPA: serine hydroxymethyltransferase [Candidatus Saccharimonadales bacterium]|nr:serine hydroxymethyltransferase [Candidatus Saccharimonadales bacterium]